MRDDGLQCCQRCSRLGKTCVTGEAKRPGRPRKTRAPTTANDAPNDTPPITPQHPQLPDNVVAATHPELYQGPDPVGLPGQDIGITSAGLNLSPPGGFIDPDILNLPWPVGSSPALLLLDQPRPAKQSSPKLDLLHQSLKELSEINVELHAQSTVIQDGTLHAYICNQTLYANASGLCIAESSLLAAQRFCTTLSNIHWLLREQLPSQVDSGSSDSSSDYASMDTSPLGNPLDPFGAVPSLDCDSEAEPNTFHDSSLTVLSTPLALTTISCYVQLLNVFTDMFQQILRYVRGLKNKPIPSVETARFIKFGNFCAMEGRLQGLLFCSMTSHSFDRIERVLGILPDDRRHSVPLSHPILDKPHLRRLLERELEREGIAGGSSSQRLRDTVETLRRTLTADPSW